MAYSVAQGLDTPWLIEVDVSVPNLDCDRPRFLGHGGQRRRFRTPCITRSPPISPTRLFKCRTGNSVALRCALMHNDIPTWIHACTHEISNLAGQVGLIHNIGGVDSTSAQCIIWLIRGTAHSKDLQRSIESDWQLYGAVDDLLF